MSASTQIPEPSISEIRDEIQSVLGSQAFRHSRGSVRLLRYMCNSALLNGTGQITEYTIAVDLFGKPVEFKESKDATVRVEVHRLRKRLEQFYEQEGLSHRVQILIPVGRYVPEFVFRSGTAFEEPAQVEKGAKKPRRMTEATDGSVSGPGSFPGVGPRIRALCAAEESDGKRPALPAQARRKWWIGVGIGFAALVLVLVWILEGSNRQNQGLETFWEPVISSPARILLCMGDVAGGKEPFGERARSDNRSLSLKDFHHDDSEFVLVADAAALARFAGLMGARGKSFVIASQRMSLSPTCKAVPPF